MKILNKYDVTVNRTLQTSMLIDGFWDRWIVHGVDPAEIQAVRRNKATLEQWLHHWSGLALEKKSEGYRLEAQQQYDKAEARFRLASLYFNLAYWIIPENVSEKKRWYEECLQSMRLADSVSTIPTEYKHIEIDNVPCAGRVRIPSHPIGCIVIVNPIDSSKEELYSYELDFVNAGYITMSFDGPGQGETYTLNGLTGNRRRWEQFIDRLIEYAAGRFPGTPLYLFGTSLGASWALYGSCSSLVSKTVAVSPAYCFENLHLPNYFLQRMNFSSSLEHGQRGIPDFQQISFQSPVLLFHGKKDLMVDTSDMYAMFGLLPDQKKQLIEYEDEGHCCNYKLEEIRTRAIQWFSE